MQLHKIYFDTLSGQKIDIAGKVSFLTENFNNKDLLFQKETTRWEVWPIKAYAPVQVLSEYTIHALQSFLEYDHLPLYDVSESE